MWDNQFKCIDKFTDMQIFKCEEAIYILFEVNLSEAKDDSIYHIFSVQIFANVTVYQTVLS